MNQVSPDPKKPYWLKYKAGNKFITKYYSTVQERDRYAAFLIQTGSGVTTGKNEP
jgi:hypothetical protein